jgi:hypothetical protein
MLRVATSCSGQVQEPERPSADPLPIVIALTVSAKTFSDRADRPLRHRPPGQAWATRPSPHKHDEPTAGSWPSRVGGRIVSFLLGSWAEQDRPHFCHGLCPDPHRASGRRA